MSAVTPQDVRSFLVHYLSTKRSANQSAACEDLPEDCDILLSGMIDSLGLLELVGAIQEFTGVDIDFEALDPEEMTVVGPLCAFVSGQTTSR